MWLAEVCTACGGPGGGICAGCVAGLPASGVVAPVSGVDRTFALLAYQGTGRDLVVGLKFHNRRGAVPRAGPAMASLVGDLRIDAVTWAPTSGRRRRARGYDQAQLLAVAVARSLHRPCRGMLRRRAGPSQPV